MEQSTPNYLSPEEHACCRSGFSSPLGTQSKERGSGKSGPKPVASDLLSAPSNADTLDPAMLPKPLWQQLPPHGHLPKGQLPPTPSRCHVLREAFLAHSCWRSAWVTVHHVTVAVTFTARRTLRHFLLSFLFLICLLCLLPPQRGSSTRVGIPDAVG